MFFNYDTSLDLKADGNILYLNGKPIVNNLSIMDVGFYKYKEIPQKMDEKGFPIYWYLSELNLEPITAEDLPSSEHIGKLKSVNPANVKPAVVTRRFMGVNYDVNCLVTQSVAELYQSGQIQIGDYVLVSFIEEIPNTEERRIAIVTDKVYESW